MWISHLSIKELAVEYGIQLILIVIMNFGSLKIMKMESVFLDNERDTHAEREKQSVSIKWIMIKYDSLMHVNAQPRIGNVIMDFIEKLKVDLVFQ